MTGLRLKGGRRDYTYNRQETGPGVPKQSTVLCEQREEGNVGRKGGGVEEWQRDTNGAPGKAREKSGAVPGGGNSAPAGATRRLRGAEFARPGVQLCR